MTSAERYKHLKESGCCIQCGKPKKTEGVRCEACRQKKNAYEKEYRRLMKEIGICVACKTNPVLGEEITCTECKNKDIQRHVKYNMLHHDEIRSRERKRRNQAREKLRDEGVCIRCGKRSATDGYKTCAICRVKINKYRKNRYTKRHPIERNEWVDNGWCYRCGQPVASGKRLCERCYDQNIENSRASASYENHWWRNANKDIFRKGDTDFKEN